MALNGSALNVRALNAGDGGLGDLGSELGRWRLTDRSVPAYGLTDQSVPAYRLTDKSVPAYRLTDVS